jgi:hypothetical protein
VDRGSFSVEVILTLLALKLAEPSCMHLTRGNHESKSMNKMYGFDGEVKAKYNNTLCEVFHETFCWLPLAFVLKSKVGAGVGVAGGLCACLVPSHRSMASSTAACAACCHTRLHMQLRSNAKAAASLGATPCGPMTPAATCSSDL